MKFPRPRFLNRSVGDAFVKLASVTVSDREGVPEQAFCASFACYKIFPYLGRSVKHFFPPGRRRQVEEQRVCPTS